MACIYQPFRRLPVIIMLVMGLLAGFSFGPPSEGDAILGCWESEYKEGTVEIFRKEGKYYGKLVSVATINNIKGNDQRDVMNKSPQLRARPLLGILVFWDMVYVPEKHRWEKGRVYSPYIGTEANGILTLKDKNTLVIKGYKGFEWASASEVWKRTE